jgi:DNA-binding PadR family transcriptional regulator
MTNTGIQAELPLTPLSYHILLALGSGEMHGYGVMKEIDRQTDGSMKPATGALYLAAKRLVDTGLIEESDARPDPELDDRRRRYYRLTDFGREVMAAETARLANLVKSARAKGLGG